MCRFPTLNSTRIRKAVIAALVVATFGVGASVAMADSWEDYGHWLCSPNGTCIWIPD